MEQKIISNTGTIIPESGSNTNKTYRQIGIRALEGSRFSINNSGEIEIGPTNIYEIDLTNKYSYIYSLECLELVGAKAYIDLVEEGE